MSNIINIDDVRSMSKSTQEHEQESAVKLKDGLIAPAVGKITSDALVDHSADPIKNLPDIYKIKDFLISNGRYRDNMLFIVGINFGLRASDLRMLRFSDVINNDMTFKDNFPVFEIKTRNTRKKKKNRYISVNKAVIEAITLYLEHTDNVHLDDYMFRSLSNRGKNENKPISVRAIEYILSGISKDLNMDGIHMSSHTLRKTFCYHQMAMSHNDSRKLLLLQKMLNHSSPLQTLQYIGITEEEIEDAYMNLNLGSGETDEKDVIGELKEDDDYSKMNTKKQNQAKGRRYG